MNDKPSKRDLFKAGALLIGGAVLGAKPANATPGADDAALAAIATNTLNSFNKLKDNVAAVNAGIAKAEKIRTAAVSTLSLAQAASEFDTLIKSQISSLKRQLDNFYRVGKDPVANPIRKISLENEPLVRFGKRVSDFYGDMYQKASGDRETRKKSSLSARNRSAVELSKVQAKETRKNIKKILQLSLKTPLDNKSTGEIFRDNAEPLRADIELQRLESQLRLEQAVVEFIEETRTGKIPEAQEFDSLAFKKAYAGMKNGDGVLL